MQEVFNFIKDKYKKEFINKIIEYPAWNTQISSFLYNMDYSWSYYWLDSPKKLIFRNSNIQKQYFSWTLDKEENLNNANLAITYWNILNEDSKSKLLSMLSFWGYLVIYNNNKIEIIQKEDIPNKFVIDLIEKLNNQSLKTNKINFEKILSNTLKTWNYRFKKTPTKFNILEKYKQLLNWWLIQGNKELENALIRKKIRSMSWISPITLLTKPFPCPWDCIFCPKDVKMPKSYVKQEAACQRALRLGFNAYDQVKDRLNSLKNAGHNTEKIELIILWWTFTHYPKSYQENFIKNALKALNGIWKDSKQSLSTLQEQNETALNKMVGLSVEIRPDSADDETLSFLRTLWVTRVEMWVQSLNDAVLKLNKRWHTTQDIIKATRILKKYWFKIMYHMMIWLPWSSIKTDKQAFKQLFSSKYYKPDQLKIYPCLIIHNTELSSIYKKIWFTPLNDNQIVNTISYIKKYYIPSYVRIARVTRDIPSNLIVEWSKSSNIREKINEKLLNNNIKCKCIRCREIKDDTSDQINISIKKLNLHEAVEYYIEATNENNKILWLARLYVDKLNSNIALVRELHVFWKVTSIENKEKKVQHKWLWERLLKKMEQIALNSHKKEISIISAIGTRGYYRKFWYTLNNTYMTKQLL